MTRTDYVKQYNNLYYENNKQEILKRRKVYLSDKEKYRRHKVICEKNRIEKLAAICRIKLHYGCQNPECRWRGSFSGCDLDLHHLNSQEKINSIAHLAHRKLEKIVGEINKCVVLCAICHRRFHEEPFELTENLLCRVKMKEGDLIFC